MKNENNWFDHWEIMIIDSIIEKWYNWFYYLEIIIIDSIIKKWW